MGEPKKETVQKWTSQQVSQWIFDRDPEFQNMLVDVLSCAFTVLIQFVCNHKLDSFSSHDPSADAFNYHNITGEILLELKESDFMKIVHDRHVTMKQEAEFLEHLSKLQRYFKKPKTRQRARRGVPSLPMLLVNAITFRFADTSEGKDVAGMKNIFYGSAYSVFCNTDASKRQKLLVHVGRALAVFYAFAGMCSICLVLSTIFAVVQIIMIYEMSDDVELEEFLDLIDQDVQLPGMFLVAGILLITVPVTSYVIMNSMVSGRFQVAQL
ncbi:hypothetical protein GUITHDRAFT_137469 [Guillardia theta CCMP2712]|uniref:Uncharacterized protein n=1 Tax=Guillardia theta (strain CCMP2712) TaxID=905079 RepID=L1JFJ3_GUITC|nr:hypothetical protein GUITHDRAFT_137469 [Guillardia theta CCMP2712]EKX47278.1 hypothetical protein GUITHDRAFT_137469 [Guillardia theta CCMP2712]|eukprot:XP_005834258.1 hypothetical protein GUITHDRAFT_137469 [Guillardia theta CCMP2712]